MDYIDGMSKIDNYITYPITLILKSVIYIDGRDEERGGKEVVVM